MPDAQQIASTLAQNCGHDLGYIRDRWNDEKEYEDWNDFINRMKSYCEHKRVKFIKAKKRPFGFEFTVDDTEFMLTATSKRIKLTRYEG